MRLLTLGTDGAIISSSQSQALQRLLRYSDSVERYDVLVPGPERVKLNPSERVSLFSVGGKTKFIRYIALLYTLFVTLGKGRYTVVSAQDTAYVALAAWLYSRVCRIGIEIQVHGFEKHEGIRKLLTTFLLRRAHSIRTVSNRLKQELIESYKVKPSIITVVPIYVPHEPVIRIETQTSPFIFLSVSRFVPVKQLDFLIRAFALCKSTHKDMQARLVLVGDGPEQDRLRNLAMREGIADNVDFVGWKMDTDTYYKQAHVFVLTSEREGWGMVVIEAARYALPIIMTDVGCAGEFIRDRQTGLVTPVGDIDALARSMHELYANRDIRERLGRAAQESLKNLPSWEGTLALYQESWNRAAQASKR